MRVQIGTTKGAKSLLHHLAHSQPQHKSARMNKAYAQLEFESLPFRFEPFQLLQGSGSPIRPPNERPSWRSLVTPSGEEREAVPALERRAELFERHLLWE